MSGPGWFCDGCGDYRNHDGRESYSVAQREARTEIERLRAALAKIRDKAEDNMIAAIADDALVPKEAR